MLQVTPKNLDSRPPIPAPCQLRPALWLVAAWPCAESFAQSESQSANALEEIVVTAQRREQSLTDVPVSVTAFSSDAIRQYKIENFSDFIALTPNVGLQYEGSPLTLDLGIRGVSNFGGDVNSVGVYVDEFNITPSNSKRAYDSNLYDVERIEVLRGPQGTLFGRNVLGGVVSVTTRKPSDTFDAVIEAGAGSFSTYRLRGSVNVPLGDSVFVRASGFHQQSDGWIDDLGPADLDNGIDTSGGRLALRLEPGDRTRVDLSFGYSEFEQDIRDLVPTGIFDDFVNGDLGVPIDPLGEYASVGFFPDNDETVFFGDAREDTRDLAIGTARLEHDFGAFTGIASVGLVDVDTRFRGDIDYSTGGWLSTDISNETRSTSFELRAVSNGDGPVSWTVGVIVANDEDDVASTSNAEGDLLEAFGLPASLAPIPGDDFERDVEIDSSGLFTDWTWTPDSAQLWTFSAGLRWSSDEIDTRQLVLPSIGNGFADPEELSGSASFSNLTGRVSALRVINDAVNAYATVSTGAKPGGFNPDAFDIPDLPNTFDEERLTNVEVGLKGAALNERLRFSLSAFWMDWEDLQFDTLFFAPGSTVVEALTLNAGEASSSGIELDFAAAPAERWTIRGGLGWNSSEFGSGVFTVDDDGLPLDISDNDLPLAPEWTANLAVQYDFPLSAGLDAFARIEATWRDDTYQFIENEDRAGDLVDGYETVAARIGIEGDRFRVVAYGENLTEESQLSGWEINASAAGVLAGVLRREYGVRAEYRWR